MVGFLAPARVARVSGQQSFVVRRQARAVHVSWSRLRRTIEAVIVRLKREYPGWGAPKIREKLRQQFTGPHLPAISTVHAVLDRYHLVQPDDGGGPARRGPSCRRPIPTHSGATTTKASSCSATASIAIRYAPDRLHHRAWHREGARRGDECRLRDRAGQAGRGNGTARRDRAGARALERPCSYSTMKMSVTTPGAGPSWISAPAMRYDVAFSSAAR